MPVPRFSITTPSFNSGDFLEDAIQSVLGQEHVTVEHIVMDGGSTDSSLSALQAHLHLQWRSEADAGQSDAINKGFLQSRGELVGWLNADDYYLPGALATMAAVAQLHPEADVFYGDCVFVDGDGKIVRSKVEHDFDPAILLHFGCYIPSTSTFFRRRVVDDGQLLDPSYRVCMDFEYFARLAHQGRKFVYVPHVIAAFRWHENNVSLNQSARRRRERLAVQRTFVGDSLSEWTLDYLAAAYRGKRILRKLLSGNFLREWRLRKMRGQDTLWTDRESGRVTCASLASL